MGVSAIAGGSSAYERITPEARAILVAKREQDTDKQQAQALLDMVKQAASGVGQRIDVYA